MYIDALVVQAVVAELQSVIVGGRIQQVVTPTDDSVALEVYNNGTRHQLLLSASHTNARLHLLDQKATRGTPTDSPLLLLLRKYVRGGRITGLTCAPLERVVTVSITKMPRPRNQPSDDDESFDAEELLEPLHSELVLEMIGRSSNLVLLDDDGIVQESVRHFARGRSSRPIVPRAIYEAPPHQAKLDPRTASAEQIAQLAGPTVARALVDMYRGVSPQTAREVAVRVTGNTNAPISDGLDAAAVANTLRSLVNAEEQRPCIAYDADEQPIAVAPFWLQQHEHVVAMPSINAALATAFTIIEQVTAHAGRRDALLAQLGEWQKRANTKVEQLRTQLARADRLEHLRWEGEMIFAYLHTVQPGQTALQVDDQTIELDGILSGVENAQRRFREYDKAKGALEHIPDLLVQAEAEAEYLRETADLLALIENYDDLVQFERELIDQGYLNPASGKKHKAQQQPRQRGPLRVISPDGWTIYVGRSAAENDQVTFKVGQSNDYWLHTRQRTGGHVIIRMQGDDVPPATLERAAQLAAYYSAARHDSAVEVDIARRKDVRRIKGGPPGLVSYTAERTVRVEPRGKQEV